MFIVQLPRNWEAAPSGDIIATVPIKDRDVHCAIGNEADPERLHAIDIIGGKIATLVDKGLRATIVCALEKSVSIIVAVPEIAALAQLIVVAVRITSHR